MKLASLALVLNAALAAAAPTRLPLVLRRSLESHRISMFDWSTVDDAGPTHRHSSRYPEQKFEQRISHFDPSTNGTFNQRWWYNSRFYKPGGPVFIVDGGEMNAEGILFAIDRGIISVLANQTNGLAVVLEHRYYGSSQPFQSLTTDDLRYLTEDEALEDSAYFIRNFQAPKELNISADALKGGKVPWIYYGGSYPGGRAAFMRTKYPDLVFGAISSSGVTHAQVDFPQYFDAATKYGPKECIAGLQHSIAEIDSFLDNESTNKQIKDLFGLGVLNNGDFGSAIIGPIYSWQNMYYSRPTQAPFEYCAALVEANKTAKVSIIGNTTTSTFLTAYASYIKDLIAKECHNQPLNYCVGLDGYDYANTSLAAYDLRSWQFQVCTQFGYYQTGYQTGPSIVSKYVNVEYLQQICTRMFPSGKLYSIPDSPRVEEINKYGDFSFPIERLAIIAGERDPWLPVTPAADNAPKWTVTDDHALFIIKDGVHCWDTNVRDNEPPNLVAVHDYEIKIVKSWLSKWKQQ